MRRLTCDTMSFNGSELSTTLSSKQNVINDGDLSISKVKLLQDTLDEKQLKITMHTSLSMNQVQVDSLVCNVWYDTGNNASYFKEGEIICNSLRLLGQGVESEITCKTISLNGADLGKKLNSKQNLLNTTSDVIIK